MTVAQYLTDCPAGFEGLVCKLVSVYFPKLVPEPEETEDGNEDESRNDSRRSRKADQQTILIQHQVQEALQWRKAFCESSDTKTCENAWHTGRARFTSKELVSLRPQLLPPQGAADDKADVTTRLAKSPDDFLAEVGLGLHLAALHRPVRALAEEENQRRVEVEVVAPDLERPVRDMCSQLIGHYIGLRGNVIRAGGVSPQITQLCFVCSRCGHEFIAPASEGRFEWPSSCPRKCRFARFSVSRERCEAIDWQRVRLQEDFLEFSKNSGPTRGMPRTVDCDLKRSLVGSCVPGDVVTLYGIIRFMPTGGVMAHGGEGRQAPSRALYVLFLEVKAVVNVRQSEKTAGQPEGKQLARGAPEPEEDFSPLQLEFIREVYKEMERFPLLVSSFCPQIYGQPLVKAALLLSLLGGLPRMSEGADRTLRRRGDIHVLLLGDPGLGKSELLRALAQLSPRGIYISGNSSTSAGLTAAVVRDGSGEMTLEAGALVLGDNGLCCIDEFDKMGQEQQALLEAMEQQAVSIAKAGIVCTLPARTTVVTAANPCKGTWDRTLTYAQNLKGVMTEALMSRFDLVFLMSDAEKQSHDAALSRHIVQRRMSGTSLANLPAGTQTSLALVPVSQQGREQLRLQDRCARVPRDAALPQELLSTYLRYARRYARPELSAAAKKRIKEEYLHQRQKALNSCGQISVTPRNLEALIRLSEARAKAELRRVVLASDVEDVLEILHAGGDFEESLPNAPVRKGKSTSNAIADQLRQYMERRIRSTGCREFKQQELLNFVKRGDSVKEQDFDKALQRLNEVENVLLLKPTGHFEFTGGV